MNFVFIMTDTQSLFMTGAYGNPRADTPNLDRLAGEGVRFDRAYTTCPLCTPARAALFSGLHPQNAGAWCNPVSPHRHTAMMGEIFRSQGYRAAYTGKWHLDCGNYYGTGIPGGGFEPDWWYDGKAYMDDLPPALRSAYAKGFETAADLRRTGFTDESLFWGYRVADRAIDFMEKVGEEPFVLACSFDEPHAKYAAPPEYWEAVTPDDLPRRPNFNAPVDGRPMLQKVYREELGEMTWDQFIAMEPHSQIIGCNRFIDRQIGRVVDAVNRLHPGDTTIIYTSDHGTPFGSHGWLSKGPAMHEETCAIPLIIRTPETVAGSVSRTVTSHVDILPTMLDLAGLPVPEVLNGHSLVPVLEQPEQTLDDRVALLNFGRFELDIDGRGDFYPVRCLTDGRYKLVINLFDTDELYDLETDPYECTNRLHDPELASERDRLHDRLLDEMDRIHDPMRGWVWGQRDWRSVREFSYWKVKNRQRPAGFETVLQARAKASGLHS